MDVHFGNTYFENVWGLYINFATFAVGLLLIVVYDVHVYSINLLICGDHKLTNYMFFACILNMHAKNM